ncbi:triosephosphate isomerase (TIM) [Phycisphaerales bacterium]|nr:triosephosphate isomerase (TIM) [Phycisphaerales bacterium]
MSDRKPFVGGNWKMNTNRTTGSDLARGVTDGLITVDGVDAAVFPPFPYLLTVRAILRDRGSSVRLGAQDVYHQGEGAFTGEVSMNMLKDCGTQVVLVGHSERRHVIGEKDEFINKKLRGVLENGLEAILCVGETLDERTAGHQDIVTARQVRTGLADIPASLVERLIIAYEPVWAIGTGKTATPEDAQDAHAQIRALINRMYGKDTAQRLRIIYGGSLKPDIAADIFSQKDVDGGLVGGASLNAADFVGLCKAAAGAGRAKP